MPSVKKKSKGSTSDSELNVLVNGETDRDNIITIEDPVEAVRKLPDVYIGAINNPGFMNMVREIVQNSGDQLRKHPEIDRNIIVSYDARSHTVIVEDFGYGIPLDLLIKAFSVLHSSSNYDKQKGEYSAGKNGMGAKICNFLSRFYTVESRRIDGTAAKAEFIEGRNKKGLVALKPVPGLHGLKTSFAPTEMMGEITITVEDVYNLLYEQCHFYPIGTAITYNSIDHNGRQQRVVIKNEHGLLDLLKDICRKPLITPIEFNDDNGSKALHCLITYDIEAMDDPFILASMNMCHTTSFGSTHVDGFINAMVRFFRDYMNKVYMPTQRNKKLVVAAQDIRLGLRAVVYGSSIEPVFTGQSKEIFSEKDFEKYAYDITYKAISDWSKQNPTSLEKLAKYFKEVCEIRSKIDNEKIKLSANYQGSAITGLPPKYKKPNGKLKELWIENSPVIAEMR